MPYRRVHENEYCEKLKYVKDAYGETISENFAIMKERGDRVFVNKLAYDLKVPYTGWHIADWEAPQRGAIVVFPSPADGTRLIKRIVGIPGDTIEMRNDQLIINGEKAKYEPIHWLTGDNFAQHGYSIP